MKKLNFWIDVLGWVGSLEVILAYALNALEILEVGFLYLFLNASGALFLSMVCYRKRAWQPLSLNVVWTVVGVTAMLRMLWD